MASMHSRVSVTRSKISQSLLTPHTPLSSAPGCARRRGRPVHAAAGPIVCVCVCVRSCACEREGKRRRQAHSHRTISHLAMQLNAHTYPDVVAQVPVLPGVVQRPYDAVPLRVDGTQPARTCVQIGVNIAFDMVEKRSRARGGEGMHGVCVDQQQVSIGTTTTIK